MLHKETVEPGTLDLIKLLMADEMLQDFFLVGGTALSLLIGHRMSIDIDLFTEREFDALKVKLHLEQAYKMTDGKNVGNAVIGFINDVKIDLITHKYPLIKPLQVLEEIRITSLEDIGAMKLNAIRNDGSRLKDFVDMYYLLEHYPFQLLGSAFEKKYQNVNIQLAGNSLLYFKDIDASVPIKLLSGTMELEKIKQRLMQAVYNPYTVFASDKISHQNKQRRGLRR